MEFEDIFDWLKLAAPKVNFLIIMNKVINTHILLMAEVTVPCEGTQSYQESLSSWFRAS